MDDTYKTWLAAAGWTLVYEEPSTGCFTYDLSDRRIAIRAVIDAFPDEFIFVDDAEVGTQIFREALLFMFKEENQIAGFARRARPYSEFTTTRGSAAFIRTCTAALIAWAENINLDQELEKVADRADGYRAGQHIAALAVLKRTAILEKYLEDRLAGKPDILVPAIKNDHISRAIEFSSRVNKTEAE